MILRLGCDQSALSEANTIKEMREECDEHKREVRMLHEELKAAAEEHVRMEGLIVRLKGEAVMVSTLARYRLK